MGRIERVINIAFGQFGKNISNSFSRGYFTRKIFRARAGPILLM